MSKTEFKATEYWKDCLSTALIGTDRRSPTAPKGEHPLVQLLQSLDWEQPASALLSATSAMTQYQAVGTPSANRNALDITSSEATVVTLSESDVIPCCNRRISKYLGITLSDYTEAAAELLELIASAGQRVPPKWLPTLLTLGTNKPHLQPLIVAVLGNRGRWLAAQNPAWQYGCILSAAIPKKTDDSEDDDAELLALQQQWEMGARSERRLALRQWRTIDPSSAREALAEGWKRESLRDREAFITALSPQLSLADEPFLEAALSDRASKIKRYAADLLATLPNSRLCQRAAERIKPFIQIHNRGEQLTINVALPEKYDTTWAKDGIQRKSQNGEGERAGWLRQMLGSVPLSTWDVDPEAVVRAAIVHEWREPLINGWATAVGRQRSHRWATAWLHHCGIYTLDEKILKALLSLLSPQEREHYLRSQLPTKANDQNLAHWLRLIAQDNQRWNFEFSRLILAELMKLLRRKPKYGDLFSPPITLAMSLHPGIAPEATTKVEKLLQTQVPTRAWQKFLDRFMGLLNHRWQIYQVFANSS